MSEREQIDRALTNVLSNAMNYPDPAAVLGKDTAPLRRKVVDAVMPLLAAAWDDGYKCGGADERHDWNGWEDPFENPYRIEDSL